MVLQFLRIALVLLLLLLHLADCWRHIPGKVQQLVQNFIFFIRKFIRLVTDHALGREKAGCSLCLSLLQVSPHYSQTERLLIAKQFYELLVLLLELSVNPAIYISMTQLFKLLSFEIDKEVLQAHRKIVFIRRKISRFHFLES